MEHAYVHLLHLLAGHPEWTYLVVFLAALLEAIAVIGTFIPGSTAMFLAGALVGTGSLNLGWALASAIAGAVAGDGMSYWLGNRYQDTIVQIWPFRKHPQVLEAGHRFFEKHGAKSVVFARLIGPLRAIVPVVAGMLDMAGELSSRTLPAIARPRVVERSGPTSGELGLSPQRASGSSCAEDVGPRPAGGK
jgi:membrane protein DedA with SNARE-associated domain